MAYIGICLVVLRVCLAQHARADFENAVQLGEAMANAFMPTGQMPQQTGFMLVKPGAHDVVAPENAAFVTGLRFPVHGAHSLHEPLSSNQFGSMWQRGERSKDQNVELNGAYQPLRAFVQKMFQAGTKNAEHGLGLGSLIALMGFLGLGVSIGFASVRKYFAHGQQALESTAVSQISLIPQRSRPIVASDSDMEVLTCMDRSVMIKEKYLPTPSETGGRIWEAGRLLSNILLSEYAAVLPKMRVLELGSGTGVGGLTAAAVGANVVLTDGSKKILKLLKANVRLNKEAGNFVGDAQVCKLDWGNEKDIDEARGNGPYDLIVGSDITYTPDVFPELLDTIEELSVPGATTVLLTFAKRYTTDEFFEMAAERNFELTTRITEVEEDQFMARLQLRGTDAREEDS